LDGKKYPYGIT